MSDNMEITPANLRIKAVEALSSHRLHESESTEMARKCRRECLVYEIGKSLGLLAIPDGEGKIAEVDGLVFAIRKASHFHLASLHVRSLGHNVWYPCSTLVLLGLALEQMAEQDEERDDD